MNSPHPAQTAAHRAMTARPSDMSLTDLHRAIKLLVQQQNHVAWLPHRHRRIQVLRTHRRSRIASIATQRRDHE